VTDARWTALLALFDAAAGRPADEREELLADVARRDPALAAEARRMLFADESADHFLEPPGTAPAGATADRGAHEAPPSAPEPAPALPAGTRIGDYRLVSVLATGGMGTVYVARQESPERNVALKVLHAGALSPAHRQRFEVESRILAHLDHPGIARVFAAGVRDFGGLPVPWFAMELVEGGRPLTVYAREAGLGVRARVELFAQVCDAVHHGHVKGVVHRDLKPANILVDGSGRPRVIDFGVARAVAGELHGATLHTVTGQIVGTLPWMSPEQLGQDPDAIDVRSDVYSMGVVLYELLVGESPYDLGSGSLVDVTRAVQEQPPRRPGAVRPELRGDLQKVMLKALEKEPARRYTSAAAFAEDLRRWLERRPVEAVPPSAWHQAVLYGRRHRAVVGAALVILVVSVVAAAVSIGAALRARDAEERSARLFGTLLDRSLAATFDLSLRTGDLPGGTALSREMVDGAVADLAVLAEQAAGDVDLAARIGHARLRLGDVLGNPSGPNLGDAAGARTQYEASLATGSGLVAAHPDGREAQRLVGLAHRRLGELDFHAARDDHGRPSLRASLAVFEALGARHPDDAVLRLDLAFAHDKLATAEGRAKDHAAAERHAQLAIAGLRRASAEGALPGDEAALRVAGVQLNLAGLHYLAGRHEEALAAYRETAAALAPLVAAEPESMALREKAGWARMWVGTTLSTLGRGAEAVPELSAALDDYRALAALDPDNVNPPVRVAHIAFTLAQIERDSGDAEAARTWLDAALAALKPLESTGRLAGALAELPARVRAERAALAGAEALAEDAESAANAEPAEEAAPAGASPPP